MMAGASSRGPGPGPGPHSHRPSSTKSQHMLYPGAQRGDGAPSPHGPRERGLGAQEADRLRSLVAKGP